MPNVVDDQPTTETTGTESRSRKGPKILLLLFVLAAIGVGVFMWLRSQGRVSTDDATVDGHVSAIAPKILGTVIEVLVKDNQPVKAGEALVRIDPRDYEVRVKVAAAALAQAESQARSAHAVVPLTNETTQSGVSAATAQLADANAELERARIAVQAASGPELAYAQANVRTKQASAERAQADLARMKPLVDKAEISRQQFDAYTAAARVAEGELQAAQEKLASARSDVNIRQAGLTAAQTRVQQAQASVENAAANRRQVPVRTADVGTATAAVEIARANLEQAELQLSYTTIYAPVSGAVTRKSVEKGNIVSPGQSLMAVIPLDDVWVTANFKETQLAEVRPGQRAEITVDMYGRKVSGHVDSIASATGSRLSLLPPENATGNFVKVVQRIPVKILVEHSTDLILRPGMNVDAVIFTK
jgi:membrane fusion protein, multidrug efflux system